jgi:hypothetical protein
MSRSLGNLGEGNLEEDEETWGGNLGTDGTFTIFFAPNWEFELKKICDSRLRGGST